MGQKVIATRRKDPQVRINFQLPEKYDKILAKEARSNGISVNQYYLGILVKHAQDLELKKEKS